MQLWPANENAFAASRVAASSRSASAATITGVAFPSSRFTRLRGARSRSVQPTPADPVNVIRATRGSSTRTSPISLAGPQTTLSQPAGRPASTSSSARNSADSGVCEAGFRTTAQPAARAGATLWATRLNGKLKGEIAPTTPIGIRSVSASLPTPAGDASIGTTSPASFRASTAAIVNVDCARAASTRAAFIGFPASSEIVRAISSARSSTRFAIRSRIAARSCAAIGVVIARCAASTARRASDAPPFATRPTSEPSYGERTSSQSPVSIQAPSMRSSRSIVVVATA